MTVSKDNLIWLDLEMTGLDPNQDRILEIATIVTNSNIDILSEGPVFAIHQPNEVLEAMDSWNTFQHTTSGLIERVKTIGVTEKKAENETLTFLKNYLPKGKSPLCGNSVCQDRRFLNRYMPTLERFFHYRHLDVSTLKILAQLWAPRIMNSLIKKLQHLALQDIRNSIKELRYYRSYFLK